MTLSTARCVAAIERHSAGLAEAAEGNLRARVEHCPEWDVADLVWHITQVHWFWATIAAERLAAPPEEASRPSRPAETELLDTFLAGAARLCDVLRAGDQTATCWTWAPLQQDVAFVTRHQVQEAVVHHWDAAHAASTAFTVEPEVAADSVAEFLTFSVSSEGDPAEPTPPALAGKLALHATDAGATWVLGDAAAPGTLGWRYGSADGLPSITATASELLLWLYRRVDLDTSDAPTDLIGRFRALTYTD